MTLTLTDIGRMVTRINVEIKMLEDMGQAETSLYQYVIGQKRTLVDTPWDTPAVMAVFNAKGE